MRRSAHIKCLASDLATSLAFCTQEIQESGYDIVSENPTHEGGRWTIRATDRCTRGLADLAAHLNRNVAGFCQVSASGRDGLVLATDQELAEKTIRTRRSVLWNLAPLAVLALMLYWLLRTTTIF